MLTSTKAAPSSSAHFSESGRDEPIFRGQCVAEAAAAVEEAASVVDDDDDDDEEEEEEEALPLPAEEAPVGHRYQYREV